MARAKANIDNSEKKYIINVCGKRREVSKEEFEKRYPPVEVENEVNNDDSGVTESNS